MHNIDRTQLEAEWEDSFEYEADPEMYGEYDEYEGEAYDEIYGETDEMYGGYEGVFNEVEEMELAAELLSLSSEEELDQFIGGLFKKIAGGAKKLFKNPAFKSLGGILKGVIKKALPIAGGALGTMIPIPGVGTALGAAAGNAAGKMFGLELEGMSAEDQEFEVARRFIRLAGDAAQEVANTPPPANPQQATRTAQTAVVSSAQRHAPGLLTAGGGRPGGQRGKMKTSGRWIRRGNAIIVIGLR